MNEIEEELLFVYNRLNEVNKNYNNYKHSTTLNINNLNYQVKNLELDFKYLNVDYSTLKDNFNSNKINKTHNSVGIDTYNGPNIEDADSEENENDYQNTPNILDNITCSNLVNSTSFSKNNLNKLEKIKELIKITLDSELNEFKNVVKSEIENVNNICIKEFLNIDNIFFTLNKNLKSLECKVDIFNDKNIKIIKDEIKEEIKEEIKGNILDEIKKEIESKNVSPSNSFNLLHETGGSNNNNLFKKLFTDFSVENAKINDKEEMQEHIDKFYSNLNEQKLEIKHLKSEIKILYSKIDNISSLIHSKR